MQFHNWTISQFQHYHMWNKCHRIIIVYTWYKSKKNNNGLSIIFIRYGSALAFAQYLHYSVQQLFSFLPDNNWHHTHYFYTMSKWYLARLHRYIRDKLFHTNTEIEYKLILSGLKHFKKVFYPLAKPITHSGKFFLGGALRGHRLGFRLVSLIYGRGTRSPKGP